MFRRPVINVNVPDIAVKVVAPPPDPVAAARLYRDLRDQAAAEVIDATVTRLGANNELIVIKTQVQGNFENDTRRVRLLFKINGKLYDITSKDVVPDMHNAVLEVLVQELFKDVLRQLMPGGRGRP